MVDKVVSGGQPGADRAGLDAAIEAGISIGGYYDDSTAESRNDKRYNG